jgi:hypothetical protein
MAKPNTQSDAMMTNESPLARAEAARYVEQQKSADFNRNLSQYMFWGATSIMGAVALGVMTTGVAALGIPLLASGAVASVATFLGSVFFSRKATEISEQSNVLYSDVDSQNQARRMVQAFARAQAPSLEETATVSNKDRTNWSDRVGGSNAEKAAGNWQSRVVAQADREDTVALQNLR